MSKWLWSGKVVDTKTKDISNANVQTEVASSFPVYYHKVFHVISSWQFCPFICPHLIFASFSHGLHPILGNLTGSAYNHFSFYKFHFYWSTAMLCQSLLHSKVTQFYTYIICLNILFHYGYSSLCCTVGPCYLSILNVMFASNSSNSQFIPLFPPLPLATASLVTYLDKSIIQKDTCTLKFVAAIFIRTKTGKQPTCPSTDEKIKKTWYIHTMGP